MSSEQSGGEFKFSFSLNVFSRGLLDKAKLFVQHKLQQGKSECFKYDSNALRPDLHKNINIITVYIIDKKLDMIYCAVGDIDLISII